MHLVTAHDRGVIFQVISAGCPVMNAQSKKQRIAQLLSSGLTANDVRLVVGVSTGYLTRLQDDEEFKEMLSGYAAPDSDAAEFVEGALDAGKEAEEDRLADRYTVLETKVVNQLIANASMADTRELTSLLATITKHRGAQHQGPSLHVASNGNVQINLTLPTNALGNDALQLSSNNEVVAVQGRSLVGMDTQGAQQLLERARKERSAPIQQRYTEEVYYDL